MTHETDFLDLYRQLGVNPGCGLAELKQAYRRQVAVLHPDRQADRSVDARASARLQRLTAQYGAAMDFHRRHGRLPGSPASRVGDPVNAGERAALVPDPFAVPRSVVREASPPAHAAHPVDAPKRRSHGRFALLLVVVALGVFAYSLYSLYGQAGAGDSPDDTPAALQAGAGEHADAGDAPALRIGMSADEVRAVEGDPVSMHGDLWEYGPSWVRFDHDRVVDWHSSPLRVLHTGEPPARDGR
ncbi:J domain-containing protein [Dyella jiangningensis]|uniref:J domain-containing protein n=1 Tax=Dyella jiangningensis TaxID=1379159 RepID=UPI001558E48D|nr:J domain-containing protein [Dyella jiangningensis]